MLPNYLIRPHAHCAGGNLKTHQSPVILDLCLTQTRSGELHDYCDVIVFIKLRFQIVFSPHGKGKSAFSHSSSLKSVFEKFRFPDGLVCTVLRPKRRNKAAFSHFSDIGLS